MQFENQFGRKSSLHTVPGTCVCSTIGFNNAIAITCTYFHVLGRVPQVVLNFLHLQKLTAGQSIIFGQPLSWKTNSTTTTLIQ